MKRFLIVLISIITYVSVSAIGVKEKGIPFFRNFSASEYGAHNRNFDVECADRGYVFVANFEGLLYYDGVDWHVTYTKDISRITCLRKDQKGRIWFAGFNAIGYAQVVTENAADSVQITWIKNGKDDKACGVESMGCARVLFVDGDRVGMVTENDRVFYVNDRKLVAGGKVTEVENLIAQKETQVPELANLTAENGLCSNSITDIAQDGHGSIWGTTDNGIFVASTSSIYTRYTEKEGLHGQVTTLLEPNDGVLYVGTLQGVFYLWENRLHRIDIVKHACWQLTNRPAGGVLAATADGVFFAPSQSTPQQMTTRHALSVFPDRDDSFLIGELDGIHRHYFSGLDVIIDSIPNASKLIDDGKGGVWAVTLDMETWHKKKGDNHFRKENSDEVSVLFRYVDDRGYVWINAYDAKGLVCADSPKEGKSWLSPFQNYSIQTMFLKNGVAWLGGNFGLIRFDVTSTVGTEPDSCQVYIRDFHLEDGNLAFAAAMDTYNFLGTVTYSYRLEEKDEWSRWKTDKVFRSENLAPGDYRIQVRARDAYGRVVYSDVVKFEIPKPFFETWYANLLYIVILSLFAWLMYQWRLSRIRREKEKLEKIVSDRTQELKDAHAQLVRKEKEATAGALTKGLIDRILNPMNYINNFSHLTLGLVKDLKDDVEDLSDEDIDETGRTEAAEDAEDVLDMMNQNLQKIEQHGVSTTRILKAMEEMLKDRTGAVQPTDIASLCQQSVDMLNTYFAEDIAKMKIKVEWVKPNLPIVSDVIAEQLTRAIMSMLGNSVYALRKKVEKGVPADFIPTIRVDIAPKSGEQAPHIILWDNGIGIEPTILEKVFDPFFTTKPTAEAPGVGLYLTKQIVEDVGGTITVTSQQGEWTEFVITLL